MQPPDFLAPFAKQVWPEVLDEIDRRGRRLLVHPQQIAMFCQCLSQYRDITIRINRETQIVEEEIVRKGAEEGETSTKLKVHPAFRVQTDLVKQASALIKEMGLNEPLEEETSDAINGLNSWLSRAGYSGQN